MPYLLISPNSGDWCKVNKCNICSSVMMTGPRLRLPSHNQPQSADLNPLIYIAENVTIMVRVDDVWIELGWWKPALARLSWIISNTTHTSTLYYLEPDQCKSAVDHLFTLIHKLISVCNVTCSVTNVAAGGAVCTLDQTSLNYHTPAPSCSTLHSIWTIKK